MTKKEAKNIFVWLVQIGERYSIPKSVVWGFITVVLGGIITMSVAFVKTTDNTNKAVPAYQAQTTQIQKTVTSLQNVQTDMVKHQSDTDDKIDKINKKQDADHDILVRMDAILGIINKTIKEK